MLEPNEYKLIQLDWDKLGFNPRVFRYSLSQATSDWPSSREGGLSPKFLQWVLATILNAENVRASVAVNHVDVEIEQERERSQPNSRIEATRAYRRAHEAKPRRSLRYGRGI